MSKQRIDRKQLQTKKIEKQKNRKRKKEKQKQKQEKIEELQTMISV